MSERCLQDEEIADYLEGRLRGRDRARVEHHMDRCDACLTAVSMARGVVRGGNLNAFAPAPPEVTERAVERVRKAWKPMGLARTARRVTGAITEEVNGWLQGLSWGSLGLQPVRSEKRAVSEDVVVVKKTFKEGAFEICFENRSGQASISVKAEDPGASLEKTRVTLLRDQRELASHLLDRLTCRFDRVPLAEYRLQFKKNGELIGEYRFDLVEKSHDG